jgi:hypothetical protein
LQIAEVRFGLDFSMKRAISGLCVTDGGGKKPARRGVNGWLRHIGSTGAGIHAVAAFRHGAPAMTDAGATSPSPLKPAKSLAGIRDVLIEGSVEKSGGWRVMIKA